MQSLRRGANRDSLWDSRDWSEFPGTPSVWSRPPAGSAERLFHTHSPLASSLALQPLVDAGSPRYQPLPTEDPIAGKQPWDGEAPEVASWTEAGRRLMAGVPFQVTMASLIMANALAIGLETDQPYLLCWSHVEAGFMLAFGLELVLRLGISGPTHYFDPKDPEFPWNVMDCLIVSLGVLDACLSLWENIHGGQMPAVLSIVRFLRILRILKIVRFLKQLYKLAFGFGSAAVAIFWVSMLMSVVLYVCSLVLVGIFRGLPEDDPDQEFLMRRFGTIAESMWTLFELISQPDIRPYRIVFGKYPLLTAFLVIFIIFGSFGMIALLTGVISESMFEKNRLRAEELAMERGLSRRLLLERCHQILDKLGQVPGGGVSHEELARISPEITHAFASLGVDCTLEDLELLRNLMDTDGTGAVNTTELCHGILQIADGVRPMMVMEIGYNVSYLKTRMDSLEDLLHRLLRVNAELVNAIAQHQAEVLQVARSSNSTVAADVAAGAGAGAGTFPRRRPASLQGSSAREAMQAEEEVGEAGLKAQLGHLAARLRTLEEGASRADACEALLRDVRSHLATYGGRQQVSHAVQTVPAEQMRREFGNKRSMSRLLGLK